jgi:small subunit ribosomal protein S10
MTSLVNKILVKLESFDHELLDVSCKKIVNILKTASLDSPAVITLPTSKRIYCVLRSPHVDKDSREHFEIRKHKRVLEIHHNSEILIFNLLSDVDLPSGIFYRICLS